jgi:hypothetical protein
MNFPTHIRDAFHRHLDQCEQCREHPFALCREGDILIRAAAREAEAEQRRQAEEAHR